MTEISEKEIEAAIKAFQMAHTAKVDIPLEQSMRDALEAAARVRAEANAEGGEPEGELCKCAPAFHEHDEAGAKHCRSCDAEWHPAPQPSRAVKALKRITQLKEVRRGGGVFDYEPALSAMEMYEIAFDALSALTAGKPGQAVSSGWQPIETAPADGRVILVYEARSAYPIHLRSADGDWWRKQGVGPSHWMPLPTPPTAGGGDE